MKPPTEADLITELELMALENYLQPWEWSYRHQLLRNTLNWLIEIARYHGYVKPIPPMPPRNGKPEPVPSVQPKPKTRITRQRIMKR